MEQTPGEHTPPLLTRGLTWLSARAGTRGQGTLGTTGHHLAGTWPRFQTFSAVEGGPVGTRVEERPGSCQPFEYPAHLSRSHQPSEGVATHRMGSALFIY